MVEIMLIIFSILFYFIQLYSHISTREQCKRHVLSDIIKLLFFLYFYLLAILGLFVSKSKGLVE